MDKQWFTPGTQQELNQNIINFSNKIPCFVAGATDLMVKKAILQHADFCIDLTQISELHTCEYREKQWNIGATITLSELLEQQILMKQFPILKQVLQVMASPQIRNRATLAGNCATASPAGDSIPVLMVLNGRLSCCDPVEKQIREIPIENFFSGPGAHYLGKHEYVQYITIPYEKNYNIWYFRKVGQRTAMTISKCSLAAVARIQNSKIISLRIACGSVAPVVRRLYKTELFLLGQSVNSIDIAYAKELLKNEIDPITDIRSTAAYRGKVTANLLEEFLSNIG